MDANQIDLILISGCVGILLGIGSVLGILMLMAKSCRDQIDDDYEQPLDHVRKGPP